MVYGRDWTRWTRMYAWRPVRLLDGQQAWLTWVEVAQFFCGPAGATPHFNYRPFGTSFVARLPDV